MIEGQGAAKAVNLTLSGRQRQIRTILPEAIQVRVNLKGLAAGKRIIRLSGKNVNLPSGVKVEQITPQSIEVNLPAGKPIN